MGCDIRNKNGYLIQLSFKLQLSIIISDNERLVTSIKASRLSQQLRFRHPFEARIPNIK